MKKQFSKIFAVLLTVSLLATQLLMPVGVLAEVINCACDEATRTGTLQESFAATCGDYGYDVYVCDECAGQYVVNTEVPTGNHDYVDHAAQAATCTEIGWDAYRTCNNCDFTEYVEIAALGHDYVSNVTNPDCENAGFTTHTCSRCTDSYTDAPVDALGHTAGSAVEENRVDADCTNPGSYDEVIYCTVCDAELVRTPKTIDPLGHDYQEVSRDESTDNCTVDGYINYECSVCHDTKQEVIPGAEKHDYDKVVTPADCDTPEITVYTCKVCGYVMDDETAPALGHTEVIDAAVAPTCTETGLTEGKHCSVCTTVIIPQEEVDALGHSHVATVVAPTCSAEGYTEHVCSACGDTYRDTIVAIDPLSHRSVITKAEVKATCVATGLTYEIACGDCGFVLVKQKTTPINPDNHNYENGTVEPTCLEDGYTACNLCGYEDPAAAVPALGHDLENHVAQDPTCTEIGWDAYDTCSRCDYTTYVEKAALGHDHIAVVTPPSCTEKGYTTHDCSRCDDAYVDSYVDATGHNDIETIGKVDPTCTEKGYTVKKCLTCLVTFRDNYLDALDHDLTQYDAQDPTCTDIGWDAYETCSRCDHDTYNELAALGHDMVEVEAKDATCTEIGWDAHQDCSRCDYKESYNELAAPGHTLTQHDAQDATCTEIGWDAYEDCSVCDYTTYVEKEALGHTLKCKPAQDPTCSEIGWDYYEFCTVCDYTEYVEKEALGHDLVNHEAKEPTIDEIGWDAYDTCSRCDYTTYVELERVRENISFTYEVEGMNGADFAVNSGRITLKVKLNVNSDIARIWGLNLKLQYSDALSLVSVNGCLFEQAFSTPGDLADDTHTVMLTQDMGASAAKEFATGEYLLATLTFKVATDFYFEDALFEAIVGESNIARDFANVLDVDYGAGASIHVDQLGDANGDGVINSTDTMLLFQWFANADIDAYDAIFDMNTDGFIDGDDAAILRGSIVGVKDYLEDNYNA